MRKILLLLIIWLFYSCASKKTTIEYKEKIVLDTISVFKDRIISKQVIDTLIVENPCDSLGILKDFEKTIKTDIAEVKLTNNKGNIQATINIDSIQQVWEKEFRKSINKDVHIKEVKVIKYKVPFWAIMAIIFLFLFNVIQLKNKLPF